MFLDPRIKDTYFETLDKSIFLDEARCFFSSNKDKFKIPVSVVANQPKEKPTLLQEIDSKKRTAIPSDKPVEAEISKYSMVAPLSISTPTEQILLWWRANEFQFPILSEMAKKYLAIPATSTPIERLFSELGLLITERRSNLAPGIIETLGYLHSNSNSIDYFVPV